MKLTTQATVITPRLVESVIKVSFSFNDFKILPFLTAICIKQLLK